LKKTVAFDFETVWSTSALADERSVLVHYNHPVFDPAAELCFKSGQPGLE
jgi:hypothetical protein